MFYRIGQRFLDDPEDVQRPVAVGNFKVRIGIDADVYLGISLRVGNERLDPLGEGLFIFLEGEQAPADRLKFADRFGQQEGDLLKRGVEFFIVGVDAFSSTGASGDSKQVLGQIVMEFLADSLHRLGADLHDFLFQFYSPFDLIGEILVRSDQVFCSKGYLFDQGLFMALYLLQQQGTFRLLEICSCRTS